MPYLTLTLSGYPVDLPPDAQVALSYRANDLRHLDSREAAFSETFTLPLTARNQAVLGNPHSLDSLTTAPYRLLPAVLTSPGGVEILNGFAILELSHDGYDVTLTDALGGLFAQVGDRALSELDLSAYDHAFTFDNVLATQWNAYTDGYCYPLVDDGRLALRAADKGALFYETTAAVFFHTLLTAIVAQALPGYQVRGSLLAEDVYQRAVLPRTGLYPQLRPSLLASYQASGRVPAAFLLPGTSSAGDGLEVQFGDVTDPGGHFFAGLYYRPPAHRIDLTVRVRLRVQLASGYDPNGVAVCTVLLRDARYANQSPAPGIYQVKPVYAGTSGDAPALPVVVEFTATLPYFSHGEQVALYLSWGNLRVTVLPGTTISYEVGSRVYVGGPVALETGLPDFSQADFLKLVCNQFNLLVQTDPVYKTVRFDLFNDLERNRARAIDWTNRLDLTSRPRLATVLGDYAQRNLLAYREAPETYAQELAISPAPYDEVPRGRATLAVVNQTLPVTAEAYTAPVALPLPHDCLGATVSLLWLPLVQEADLSNPVEPWDATAYYSSNNANGHNSHPVAYGGATWKCIYPGALSTQPGYAPEPGWQNSDTLKGWEALPYEQITDSLPTVALVTRRALPGIVVRDDAPSIKAYNPTMTLSRDGLEFADLLPAYYPGLANILKRVQVLTLDVRLTALDIADLDYTIPVRVDVPHVQGYGQLSAELYLNNIDQYIPSQPGAVACTFLVLGTPVAGIAPSVPFPPVRPRRYLTTEVPEIISTEDNVLLLTEY